MSTGLAPFPVLLTLQVATASLLLATPIGIALAFCQARFRYRLSAVVDAVILLPLVLPPSVVGAASLRPWRWHLRERPGSSEPR